MNTRPRMLLANDAPRTDSICTLTATVGKLEAASGDDKKLRRFRMEAYNGGLMKFWWSDEPVVVDIAGLSGTDRSRPILKDHMQSLIVGHTTKIDAAKTLSLEGVVSGTSRVATEVVEAADNGFPWEASIGVLMERIEFIAASQSVTVNGQTFTGPLRVVRAGTLKEVSFVALGADDSTEAAMVAAQHVFNNPGPNGQGNPTMNKFHEWLKAQGWSQEDIDALKEGSAQHNTLHAAFKASEGPAAPPVQNDPLSVDLQAMRKQHADEARRIANINALCAGGHADLQAKAIEGGWSAEKTELEVLRASGPTAPNIGGGQRQALGAKVLEAAAVITSGHVDGIDQQYDDQTLEAAARLRRDFGGGFSLQGLILTAARCNGYSGNSMRVDEQVMRAAFGQLHASGQSTVDISGILSNIANKFLLNGFMAIEQTWSLLANITSVLDFKTHHRYRLTGDAKFEKVGNGGEIKAGTLGNQDFQVKADTHAKLFGISRQDMINDDLGALTSVPQKLGRGGGLQLNSVFWNEWLNDAAFFTSDNKNLIVGANTALASVGLGRAVTAFRRQTDPDGNPLGVEPRVLIVPPELEAIALELTRSVTVNTGGAATTAQVPNANIYAGRYQVGVSQYLSADKAWYLAANPADLAAIEVAFLNGQRTPIIEQADADFSQLGVQMRGYFDFGVAKQDHRGAVKAKGEA